MTEQGEPSAAALKWAKMELDRIERQERSGLPIWANSPANVHDLASLLDIFASRIYPPGETSEDVVERVARAICGASGVDPDLMCIGLGHQMPVGERYPAWRAREGAARAAISALPALPELREGHDRPCHYCGERCNALAGNPSLWPVLLPFEPGITSPAHVRCVMERLKAAPQNDEPSTRTDP